LKFKGDEIYTRSIKELAGRTFREALFMFEDSTILGLSDGKKVSINPPAETVISENEKVIAISADDDTIILSGRKDHGISENRINIPGKKDTECEKILILGWNKKIKIIISELIKYIAPGSEITLVAGTNPLKEFSKFGINDPGNNHDLLDIENVKLHYIPEDINDHELLENLAKKGFDHIVILAYTDKDPQEADCITLMALVHLRDIAENNNLDFSLTSEMLDINNRDLAKVAKVNDFIVSEKLTSLLLAQISENKLLNPVFKDLLDEAGSEISLRKIKDYIEIGEPVNFYTIVEAAVRKNELAVGYKIISEEILKDKNFGIYLNPAKSSLIDFTEDDVLIVLSVKSGSN